VSARPERHSRILVLDMDPSESGMGSPSPSEGALLLERTCRKVETARREVLEKESNPDTLVEWLLSCRDVKVLLGAVAAHIRATSSGAGARTGSGADIVTLKRTYSKLKAELGTTLREQEPSGNDNAVDVEWLFSCTELGLLLTAASTQVKPVASERTMAAMSWSMAWERSVQHDTEVASVTIAGKSAAEEVLAAVASSCDPELPQITPMTPESQMAEESNVQQNGETAIASEVAVNSVATCVAIEDSALLGDSRDPEVDMLHSPASCCKRRRQC